MSSSDGLKRLTEYLNQTRRQAEASIDILNQRITELEEVNEKLKVEAERLRTERDYFLGLTEQLKIENSTKWRLQERDDWKALVESVQSDRARLQESSAELESKLEEANIEIARLEKELELSSNRGLTAVLGFGTPASNRRNVESPSPTSSEEVTPRTLSRQLKVELEKTISQMEVDRRTALTEKLSQDAEIKKLKTTIDILSKNQKTETFPNGIPGAKTYASSADTTTIAQKNWGTGLGGLLYLVWNGISLPSSKKNISSNLNNKKSISDVIHV